MNFGHSDGIFFDWARRHGLHVYTECKDEAVRMVHMYGQGKEFADIGVSEVSPGQFIVSVGIARRPSRKSQFEQIRSMLEGLDDALERAYEKARSWL